MSLNLTRKERAQAQSYRAMLRRVKTRRGATTPARLPAFRARQIDPQHKAAISKLFCIATAVRSGHEFYNVHVAHIRFSHQSAGARNPGLQRKPDDRWTLPLSPLEHRLQHSMSEAAFWAELGVDPHALALALWQASPDTEAMLQILRQDGFAARQRLLRAT